MLHYQNPIVPGFYPDPSICRVENTFYLINSSFEYFPGIPIFKSEDLVNWEQIGHVLTREEQLPLTREHSHIKSQGIFAPTIRYHQGRFYVITTNITIRKSFVVWSDTAEGPWSDPIYLEWQGYDPSLYFEEDGTVYLTGAGFPYRDYEGIWQVQLDLQTGKNIGEPQMIWKGTGGASPEGPHLYKMKDWYYLMISEGGTEYGHMVTISRSREPFGPFEECPKNPILSNRSTSKEIQATGHADLVEGPDGRWWAVFLGIRPVKQTKMHHLGRETHLAPVHFDEESWPIIGSNGLADSSFLAPGNYRNQDQHFTKRDDFETDTLSFDWNFLRNPDTNFWHLSKKASCLTLFGRSSTLSEPTSVAFVGRRQQQFNVEAAVAIDFKPLVDGEEAGLTVFMNDSFHYDLAIVRTKGKTKYMFRRQIGSVQVVEKEIEVTDGPTIFQVKANETMYEFSVFTSDGVRIPMGSGETAFLSSQVAGGFTGVYFAMYATGNGRSSTTPAHFDYFDYTPY